MKYVKEFRAAKDSKQSKKELPKEEKIVGKRKEDKEVK
jgi:hypothetical protein